MKNTVIFFIIGLCITIFGTVDVSFADDGSAQSAEVSDSNSAETQQYSSWEKDIKTKYELTDVQMQKLKDSGLNQTQATKAAHLAYKSEKPLEDVLKMRTEQKMGWGKIAKEIGVHPSEIGKATASSKIKEKNMKSLSKKRNIKTREKHMERMSKKAERTMKRKMKKSKKRDH